MKKVNVPAPEPKPETWEPVAGRPYLLRSTKTKQLKTCDPANEAANPRPGWPFYIPQP